MIEKIFDFLFLDRETRNLQKITKLISKITKAEHLYELMDIYEETMIINTKEHKEKIDIILVFITLQWQKILKQ